MTRKTVIIVTSCFALCIFGLGGYFLFSGEEEEGVPVATFTPPPMAEDAPMSGSDMDAIYREMQEKNK